MMTKEMENKVLYEMANNVVVSVFNFWLLEVVLQ